VQEPLAADSGAAVGGGECESFALGASQHSILGATRLSPTRHRDVTSGARSLCLVPKSGLAWINPMAIRERSRGALEHLCAGESRSIVGERNGAVATPCQGT